MSRKILVGADLNMLAGVNEVNEMKEFLHRKIGALIVSSLTSVDFSRVVYFGRTAADLDSLLQVRSRGGLAVVLNANEELLSAAPIALKTGSAWPIALLVAIFAKWGLAAVFQAVIMSETPRNLRHLMLPPDWEAEITDRLAGCDFSFHWTICPIGFKRAAEN